MVAGAECESRSMPATICRGGDLGGRTITRAPDGLNFAPFSAICGAIGADGDAVDTPFIRSLDLRGKGGEDLPPDARMASTVDVMGHTRPDSSPATSDDAAIIQLWRPRLACRHKRRNRPHARSENLPISPQSPAR